VRAQHQKTLLDADKPMNIFFTDVTEFPPHWHEVVEMVYVPEGSLKVGVNSEIYTMNSKDILLISSGDVHYFVSQPKQVRRLILHFDMSFLEALSLSARNKRFAEVLLTPRKSPNQANNTPDQVHRLLEEQITKIIEEYNGKKEGFKIALKARFYDILALLLRYVPMQAYTLQQQDRRWDRLGRLENVLSYVEQNYCSEITLKEISSVANFSAYYFTRFFKEATGMTFGKYINNYRVEKAARLLKNSNDQITEVAFKSGFGSIKTFNRVFNQIKGCSPSFYKKDNF
jgi:AraC-like DNA-binding protein